MKVSDFSFELPDELIARYPQAERSASRLMSVDGSNGDIEHHKFYKSLNKSYSLFCK